MSRTILFPCFFILPIESCKAQGSELPAWSEPAGFFQVCIDLLGCDTVARKSDGTISKTMNKAAKEPKTRRQLTCHFFIRRVRR